MNKERRTGGRRGKSQRGGATLPQLPWRRVTNPYAPLEIADEEQMDALHRTSMRILSELGIRVMGDRVLDLFERAGAKVDRETREVKLDAELVDQALSTVQQQFTLTGPNPDKALNIGGRDLTFGLIAGPPNVHDCLRGRRTGNQEDYENFIRLAHHFNAIHLIGNQASPPQELPANTRHLDTYHANLTLSDLSFHCTAIGRGRARDGIEMMAIARGMTPRRWPQDPGVITIISVNSPRLFDGEMGEWLIAMAEMGQPVTITPFTLDGRDDPGDAARRACAAERRGAVRVVLTQLVNPGTPVMYGAFTSNVDMRSGAPAFGTPENTKANIIAGQLARRYGLPYRSSNANASNVGRSASRLRDRHGDLGRGDGRRAT